MYRKKSAFSLIEIIIAFTLAAILFGCIFSNFYQTRQIQSHVEEVYSIAINRQAMQLHLHSLFSQIPSAPVEEDEKETESTPPVYIDEFSPKRVRALWFSTTAEYSSDRRFVGLLTHCLYLNDKSRALQLLTRNKDMEEKTEEVMHHVQAWEFQLFDPQKKIWVDNWPKKSDQTPTLLKLKIVEKWQETGKGEAVEFAFTFPAAHQPFNSKAAP